MFSQKPHIIEKHFLENNKCHQKLTTMAFYFLIFLFYFSLTVAHPDFSHFGGSPKGDPKTYIVHVKQPDSTIFSQSQDIENWHQSFLPASVANSKEEKRIVYSYRNVISGFAAKLTEDEVKAMKEKDGFIAAHPERMLQLQTTHTPDFLGLHAETGFWKNSNFGKGMIIGLLDSGILPTHPSFNDHGMPPPPSKWKGRCDFNVSVCNNKLIGARSFIKESTSVQEGTAESPLDIEGHGKHTASTAAGAFVKDANVLGNAYGTASGMAPLAHLAIYKVCGEAGCPDSAMLAALDAAVEDGVDILSMSIGGLSLPFYEDTIAVGSFAAIQKGIFVSCSAGNDGPFNGTLSNEAPWILTVGASTIDRSVRAVAKLGNGEEFDGESLFQPKDFPSTLLPLVYAGAYGDQEESAFCAPGSLNGSDVVGKVVVCVRGGDTGRIAKGVEVLSAGGAAMILVNDEPSAYSTLADAHVLPAAHVSFADGLTIMAYINSSATPVATIAFKGTVIGKSSAPRVTSFSSRGPSTASPGILKPDVIGPGVGILAAWPFPLDNTTNTTSTFNIISGTSMSCPHLSGIATLLKNAHPDWSPAAIKSAIMTTADLSNLEGKPILDEKLYPADIFATGSGHVNPSRASDPGFVYDIQPDDYIPYLCGLGYTDDQIGVIAQKTVKCSNQTIITEGELNYPSFSVKLGPSQTFTRTVANVGEAESSYELEIVAPHGVVLSVKPDKLDFSEVNQKLTYSVTFTRTSSGNGISPFAQGFLKWVSPKRFVRSPISIAFQ